MTGIVAMIFACAALGLIAVVCALSSDGGGE